MARQAIAGMVLLGAGLAAAAGAPARAAVLRDKTLVAWVRLANTTQRAGGILTVQQDEVFDSLVLGERVPGRWMAGSDFFHRTSGEQEQAACPAETAGPEELVQVALVYEGPAVRLYRNGKLYSSHRVETPQAFEGEFQVLLGLRYAGKMGSQGFFAGEIEEARLYDTALSATALAALAPDKPSEPKPLGQWTFEDGTVRDRMGHFARGRLHGAARIVGGRLIIDGKNAYVQIGGEAMQSLFYKARTSGNMWDTWLYHDAGTFYLYTLCRGAQNWDAFALATSPDGVNWEEQGTILTKSPDAVWMGTGSTWKSPRFDQEHRYLTNFSEWRGQQQTIFFAESPDLRTWKPLGKEFEFRPDPRWYQVDRGDGSRWDCIWTIARPGGGLYGYWTATPKPETGGRFGFGQSLDGVTWEALRPPKVVGVDGDGEVGAVERVGERWVMLWGQGGRMYTLTADRPEGPFAMAKRNRCFLSGHTYFARFFPAPDGLLVNHHSWSRDGEVCFAPLKRAHVDREGTLRLKWWEGNEKLKGAPMLVAAPGAGPAVPLLGPFDVGAGLVLEGTLSLPAGPDAPRPGVYLESAGYAGTGILVGPGGVTELGPIRLDGTGFKAEDRVDREAAFGKTARFRLLMKGSLLEFYLDDILMQCWALPGPATGMVGLIHPDAVREVKAWRVVPAPR